jgi:hypothetical protein
MPWFNVDDGFANSKPVLKIPRRFRCAAVGLWTLAGSWSAKELTDGFIPDEALEEFAGTVALAEFLVKAGLWRKVAGGWQFEGWSKWQKTKERVLAYREKEAEKKRGQRSNPKPAGSESVSPGDSLGTQLTVPRGQDRESRLCPAPPLPTPSPFPILETLGGGVTEADDPEPPRYCIEHPNDTAGYCPECIPLRKEHDAWKGRRQQREDDEVDRQRQKKVREAQQLKDCVDCDEEGWRYDDREIKCKHNRDSHQEVS